jgi:hypothetical protein
MRAATWRGRNAYDAPGFTRNEALSHACILVGEGRRNVTISDNYGHSISGDSLYACCQGRKTLTDDLQAT